MNSNTQDSHRQYAVNLTFFNAARTTEIYTLSLHDALPICGGEHPAMSFYANYIVFDATLPLYGPAAQGQGREIGRATSELQSRFDLVCRLLLEKKKDMTKTRFVSLRLTLLLAMWPPQLDLA